MSPAATSKGSLGLDTMSERAELFGGSLRIEDERPGTRVVLTIPRR